MLNLLKRNKASIDSILLPDYGWTENKNEKTTRQWINPEQTAALSINFFKKHPDIPSIKDLELLRAYFRTQLLEVNGGLIEVEPITLQHYAAVKTVFKIPQEDKATTYLTSLTVPFKNCSFVIKIEAVVPTADNLRESVITKKLLREGTITLAKKGYNGWSADPYYPDFDQGTLMNQSEKEIYDDRFAMHPLSQSRKLIKRISEDIRFGDDLAKLKPFTD